jgi:hypothetical protein
MPASNAFQRTRSAPLRSPLSLGTLGNVRVTVHARSVLLGTVMLLQAWNAEPSSAPQGLEWYSLPPIRAKVLKVIGWNFAFDRTEAGWTYSSGENDERGIPSATYVLAVVKRGQAKPAGALADELMTGNTRGESLIGDARRPNRAGFATRSGFFVRQVEPEPEQTHRVFIEVLVSRRTGTAYVALFEAPSSLWDQEWKIGEVIVNSLRVRDDV